jgi:hypothetical protein
MANNKPPLRVVETTPTGIQPPRKLGRHGMALWQAVHAEYRIVDRGGIEILSQICAAADRAEALADCVARDGETIRTKAGLRVHPAMREELACRTFICRALERLGLNIETVKSSGRPGYGIGWRLRRTSRAVG